MPACERLDDRAGVRLRICMGRRLQTQAACPNTPCRLSGGSFLHGQCSGLLTLFQF